jgi:hypothetical protein
MTENCSLALVYARHGVLVLPCREGDGMVGKAKAPYVEGGWHSASSDEYQINLWWSFWPNAAIGLPARANGIIAFDADRHGADDGVAILFSLFAQHAFSPYTVPCVTTPRDGRHLIFRRPAELQDTRGKIASAVDIRDNAYVVAAGTRMANGLCYLLENGSPEQLAAAIGTATLPELPVWLAAMIVKPPLVMTAPNGPANLACLSHGGSKRRLAGLIRKVVLARNGERNVTLHWAACRVGELVSAGAIKNETAIALLTTAGLQAGLPIYEALATIQSGIRGGSTVFQNGQ